MIKKVKICDNCHKQEDLYPLNLYSFPNEEWFFQSIDLCLCTEKCWNEYYNKNKSDK